MSSNLKAQQSLAERLADVLRLFKHEGGDIHSLASKIGEETRDLQRWADGTKMPAHVLLLLLDALPRHFSDQLIAPTGLRLIAVDACEDANVLIAAAQASQFSGNIAKRMADQDFCHKDKEETRKDARRLIADLQPLAGE